MRIAIVSTQLPFVVGGAELLTSALEKELIHRKINVEVVKIPFFNYSFSSIKKYIQFIRSLDFSIIDGKRIDKVITMKFPAYYCQHENKNLWLLHQYREVYDLFNSSSSGFYFNYIAKKIKKMDNSLLPEHKKIFAQSRNIATRLCKFNHIVADGILYPPPLHAEKFNCKPAENFILYSARFDHRKRHELIIEAMAYTPIDLKLVLLNFSQTHYGIEMAKKIETLQLQDKIIMKGFVTEEEKIDLYSRCLAIYNGPYDEDYGYLTIEGFLSAKPVITHIDSGGVLEFVKHGVNGYVVEPNAQILAEVLHHLVGNKNKALSLGQTGRQMLLEKNITWDHTIEKLLG